MPLPKKRAIGTRRKGKVEELSLYDYYTEDKMTLRYVGRPKSVPDPGVRRQIEHLGTNADPLCKMLHGDLLTGQALEDAKNICPPKPDDYIFPDRYVKSYEELDANQGFSL